MVTHIWVGSELLDVVVFVLCELIGVLREPPRGLSGKQGTLLCHIIEYNLILV